MSVTIKKIHLINYKRFKDYTIEPNEKINILAGDNEVGKSSILEAIDLVASGNVRRVEAMGIDRLMNVDTVQRFLAGKHTFDTLPPMIIELYLDLHDAADFTLNGKNNTSGITCDGIRLVCEANFDYRTEIEESMKEQDDYFPYDYYSIRFSTFADKGYSGYKKKLRTTLIDSGNMNSEYATNDFIRRMYHQYTDADVKERAVHRSKYRRLKESFRTGCLDALNKRVSKYAFGLKMTATTEFENNLMIYENEIGIDSKGMGTQVFIKTDFALERAGDNVDVILLEEPENHLSHTNLRKLVKLVSKSKDGQLFITTHNSLISTRLELQNVLLMGPSAEGTPISLYALSEETSKYFVKAPVANMIEFSISEKLILVEGPSEYMLLERFYETITEQNPETDGVHIIDVHGLSFKRYLEVARLLGNKVAVITDNDKDRQRHCIDKYTEFANIATIQVFSEVDDAKYTFEVVLYHANQALCDRLFGDEALEYMLNNKTEAAYQLLSQNDNIQVPEYIQEAIKWIRE